MSKNKGWIKLHRKIQDSSNYFDEPFCRNMAWVDMLLLANHDENSFRVRGIKVYCKRGQIGFTPEKLGIRWTWSRGKVLRFLKELQNDGMIVQQKNNVTTLITILNYDKYQGDDTANSTTSNTTNGTTERQQTVQQTDINKNDKEDIKNDKEVESRQFDVRGIVVYDAEKEVLANQMEFERICITTRKDLTQAKDSLRKYHLYLQEKEQYPKGRKAVFAGFEKWLMNEAKYNGNQKPINGKQMVD